MSNESARHAHENDDIEVTGRACLRLREGSGAAIRISIQSENLGRQEVGSALDSTAHIEGEHRPDPPRARARARHRRLRCRESRDVHKPKKEHCGGEQARSGRHGFANGISHEQIRGRTLAAPTALFGLSMLLPSVSMAVAMLVAAVPTAGFGTARLAVRLPLPRAEAPRCSEAPVPPPEQPPPPAAPPPTESPPQRTFSTGWSGEGKFADEDALPLSFWLLGSNPRRAILPTLAISIIAPAVNLWGSGSFLLSLAPDLARQQGLDTFYPVSSNPLYPYTTGSLDYGPGFKRYVDPTNRFEFRFPATYVQDQAVFLKNADRAYQQRMSDPQGVMSGQASSRRVRGGGGPDVAFGPPGQTGAENLSVVIGSLEPGFTLRGTLGAPAEGAERLLQATIAKAGLREVTLLSAAERRSEKSGKPLYQFEYRVDYPGLEGEPPKQAPTFTVCVVGATSDTLFTFASRVPSATWETNKNDLRETASSFVLL